MRYIPADPMSLKEGDVIRVNKASVWTILRVKDYGVDAISLKNNTKGYESLTFNNLFEKEV